MERLRYAGGLVVASTGETQFVIDPSFVTIILLAIDGGCCIFVPRFSAEITRTCGREEGLIAVSIFTM
jgi:hypothetical protein